MASTPEILDPRTIDIEPLDIVVLYTTPDLTRAALEKARELTAGIPARIRILRMQKVPFPLPLQESPVAVDVLREQIQEIAVSGGAAEIVLYLTREPTETLLKSLTLQSIVVMASKRRPWRTAQERLKRVCERHGSRVALVYV